MSQRQASHRSVTLLLCLVLLAVAAAALSGCASAKLAADIPTGKAIHIHMKGRTSDPIGPKPYKIDKVLPNSKGICRDHQTDDCKPTVSWQIKGKPLPTGWYLMVQLKADATKKCFANAPYKIADGNEVDSGPVDGAVCTRWDAWPYDVILHDAEGAVKDRLDPLLVINH